MLSDSEVAAINAAIDVFMLDDREHLAARLRAIRVRLTASAQAPTRLLTEGQDEVGEIQARHEKAEAGRGPFTEDEGFDAHQNRATLLRILKSQVPQAPVVDEMRTALERIIAEPYGCSFCDSGKLRNPAKTHDENCGFELARLALISGRVK